MRLSFAFLPRCLAIPTTCSDRRRGKTHKSNIDHIRICWGFYIWSAYAAPCEEGVEKQCGFFVCVLLSTHTGFAGILSFCPKKPSLATANICLASNTRFDEEVEWGVGKGFRNTQCVATTKFHSWWFPFEQRTTTSLSETQTSVVFVILLFFGWETSPVINLVLGGLSFGSRLSLNDCVGLGFV